MNEQPGVALPAGYEPPADLLPPVDEPQIARLRAGFPTTCLAVIAFDADRFCDGAVSVHRMDLPIDQRPIRTRVFTPGLRQ